MKKHLICTCLTGLSYADRVSVEASLALILNYKVSLFSELRINLFKNSVDIWRISWLLQSRKQSWVEGQNNLKKEKKKSIFSSASLSLWKMQFWVTMELSAQQLLQTSVSTKHKRQQKSMIQRNGLLNCGEPSHDCIEESHVVQTCSKGLHSKIQGMGPRRNPAPAYCSKNANWQAWGFQAI